MIIPVTLWSYFRDLAGVERLDVEVSDGATLGELVQAVHQRHPRLAPLRASTLMAVGVDYQTAEYRLRAGDEVSLFPPVQGG